MSLSLLEPLSAVVRQLGQGQVKRSRHLKVSMPLLKAFLPWWCDLGRGVRGKHLKASASLRKPSSYTV